MEKRDQHEGLHAYWQAANYLSAAQVCLKENVLLRKPLEAAHLKPFFHCTWGHCLGLNFIYAHLNRIIIEREQPMLFVAGPAHNGPALVANTWLDGSYSSLYPDTPQNIQGLEKLVHRVSRPDGLPSHVAANIPGSIHEGGGSSCSLAHAFGAVFDHPDLIAACVIDASEAETGALAAAWQSVHFLNPQNDGAVLPVLLLNDCKASGPTVLGRLPDTQLNNYFSGLGYNPFMVDLQEQKEAHRNMARTLDKAYNAIRQNQKRSAVSPAVWPVLILRPPRDRAWPGSELPMAGSNTAPDLTRLEQWLRSFHPERHFNENGEPTGPLREMIPPEELAIGLRPQANARHTLTVLKLPNRLDHTIDVDAPGALKAAASRTLGGYLQEVFELNKDARNFRLFSPGDIHSNRLDDVFKATARAWSLPTGDDDETLAPDGRVMEILCEHCCQGWLEGYLRTGRHGLFPCNEALAPVVDSMVTQHAEWLMNSRKVSWREPRASLNYLLTSHAWQQVHSGYSHQNPGFINSLLQKQKKTVRIYLPPDANTLLCTMDHCLRSHGDINLVISGRQPMFQWLDMDTAADHFRRGASTWPWAGRGKLPDMVLACAGDTATVETLAAAQLLREHVPGLAFQVVNVIDLMSLALPTEHPHGLRPADFEGLFTADKPVIFAFHGYPSAIRELIYSRPGNRRFHVHGYLGEDSSATPFDRVVRNRTSRYDLALDALQHTPPETEGTSEAKALFTGYLQAHDKEILERGEDRPEIKNWTWQARPDGGGTP